MRLSYLVVVLLGCLSVDAYATEAPADADGRAEVQKVVKYCPPSLEGILPGNYYFCSGTTQFAKGHLAAARARMRDAAYWASKPAQYVLGVMYINGDTGERDAALGVAWLALAAERHDPAFEKTFVAEYSKLTATERQEADRQWLALRDTYGDKVAGRRAVHRYERGMHDIREAEFFGGSMYLAGVTPAGEEGGRGQGHVGPGGGSSAFGLSRTLDKSASDFFRGMGGTVTVGAIDHPVPLSQIAPPPQPAASGGQPAMGAEPR